MLHYLVFKVQRFEYVFVLLISAKMPLLATPTNITFGLVEMRRIELLTPCLQGRCSPS